MSVTKILDFIKVNAKSIVVFVVGVIINAVLAVINGQMPWPTTLKGWGTYLGTSLVAAIAVWAIGNKLTVDQVLKGAGQLGLSVGGSVPQLAIDAASNAAQAVVTQAAADLPKPARDTVTDLAALASNAVADVLRNFTPGR